MIISSIRFSILPLFSACIIVLGTCLLPQWALGEEEMLPAELLQISATTAFSKYVFLVDKTERKLLVYERDLETVRKIDEFPADIGKTMGPKVKANDFKTPEGIYFFQKKLTQPEIPFQTYGKMAFTTDYPNLFDRLQHKTGNGIWLHSIPESVPLTRGSRGCVVIRNDVLAKAEQYIKFKETPMIIYDKLTYIPKSEHDEKRKVLSQWLENWRGSWASMNVESYMQNYHPAFTAPGFKNLAAWEKHKQSLKQKYQFMKISLSQPFMIIHKDQLIVKTLQKYESDLHVDYGVKTIHALKIGNEYKIIHEDWVKADENGATALAGTERFPNSETPAPVKNP